MFFIVLPEWLMDNVKALAALPENKFVNTDTNRVGNPRATSRQLEPLKAVVTKALEDYSKPEVKTELVILYVKHTQATAWLLESGEFVQNGGYDKNLDMMSTPGVRGWQPEFKLNATNDSAPGYSVLMGACVYTKVTMTRGSSVTHSYSGIGYDGAFRDPQNPARLLNAFVGIHFPAKLGVCSDAYSGFRGMEVKEMPYSEEAAMFFVNMQMGLVNMAYKIEKFFGQPDLESAIKRIGGSQLLLEAK